MGTEEAIDLIETLPNGSMYVSATNPLRAWSDEKVRCADVIDEIAVVAWALGAYDREAHPEPPKVERPHHRLVRAATAERKRRAKAELESDQWEEL